MNAHQPLPPDEGGPQPTAVALPELVYEPGEIELLTRLALTMNRLARALEGSPHEADLAFLYDTIDALDAYARGARR